MFKKINIFPLFWYHLPLKKGLVLLFKKYGFNVRMKRSRNVIIAISIMFTLCTSAPVLQNAYHLSIS